MSGPGALYVGPGALCVGQHRAPALSVSGLGALLNFWIKNVKCFYFEKFLLQSSAVCVGPRRSLCRAPTLAVSGPAALCLGPGALCRALALSASGPGVLYPALVLCVGPRALNFRIQMYRHFSCNKFFGAKPRRGLCRGPGALCVGPRRSVSGPGTASRSAIQSCTALHVCWIANTPSICSYRMANPCYL